MQNTDTDPTYLNSVVTPAFGYDYTSQTIDLMTFRNDAFMAVLAMGHVGAREFRRAMIPKFPEWDPNDYEYQYAVFNDDESIQFNARPDDPAAKPVTVWYFGARHPVQQA